MFRVLHVDLSREKFRDLEIEDNLIEEYLGGKGLGVKLFHRFFKGGDALSPENVLIFMAGPLSATPAPSSGRMCAVARSPLTNGIAESHCGGYLAFALRRAGYLGVIITGKARDRVYLKVDEEPELRDADNLWGLNTRETEQRIKEELGRVEVACIGRAGENMVRFASIIHQGHRAFGRAGMGAVMGSKNLKAIAARGDKKIELKHRQEFIALVRKLNRKLAQHPTTGRLLREYGTSNVLSVVNHVHALPTRNFSQSSFEGAEKISGEALKKFIKGSYGCYACAIKCGKIVEIGDVRTKSLEYETLYALGANLGLADLKTIARLNEVCNSLGMDTISFGVTLAGYVEASQIGIFDEKVNWGDGEAFLKIAKLTAEREGIGKLIAEGSYRMLESHRELSMSVKGLEMPGYHPKEAVGVALAYATSNRGACHLRAPVYIPELLTGEIDRRKPEGKAELVKNLQDFHAALDSLILCKFTSRALKTEHYTKLFYLATGIKLEAEEFLRAGERIFNLEREINLKLGVDGDELPERVKNEHLNSVLQEYYSLRGWIPKNL